MKAGDHVATMLPNTFDSHRAVLGLGWLRAVEVPLNVSYVGRMLAYTLDLSDATTLLVAEEFVERVDGIRADVPSLETVVVVDADEFGGSRRAARRVGRGPSTATSTR